MPTRTKTKQPEVPTSPDFIEKTVNERGFYLYEWISPEELRMSILSDYLAIIQTMSIPLAIITVIAALFGYMRGIIGVIVAVLIVLMIFYGVVAIILIVRSIRKSYLYARGGNLVVTDYYYVSNGVVVERSDLPKQQTLFRELETTFREPLFSPSGLGEQIDIQKKSLWQQLNVIASGGGKIMDHVGGREAASIFMIFAIVGALYGGMMALIYFLGIFLITLIARFFALIAHRALLIANNTEHTIQTLFGEIFHDSVALKEEKKSTVTLLTEAGRDEWVDNLSGRLEDSFALIEQYARDATDNTLKLKKLLESSKYKEIFNWVKYGNWIKTQVLEPIREILDLLRNNRDTIRESSNSLEKQIRDTSDPSQRGPLEAQKKRFEMQLSSLNTTISLLEQYEQKLT